MKTVEYFVVKVAIDYDTKKALQEAIKDVDITGMGVLSTEGYVWEAKTCRRMTKAERTVKINRRKE